MNRMTKIEKINVHIFFIDIAVFDFDASIDIRTRYGYIFRMIVGCIMTHIDS